MRSGRGYYRYVGKRPSASDISTVMAELGRRGGAAKNGAMNAEERKAAAKKAADARWGKNGTAAAALEPDTDTELAESVNSNLKK